MKPRSNTYYIAVSKDLKKQYYAAESYKELQKIATVTPLTELRVFKAISTCKYKEIK